MGVGQIGGSLAWALRKNRLADEVIGAGRSVKNLRTALSRGCVDSYTTVPARAVKGADLVVLAAPVTSIPGLIASLADHIEPGAVVTDVGSVKGAIEKSASVLRSRGISFVGGHPIAGSERSGASSAAPDLFRGRVVILTPTPSTNIRALSSVRKMWASLGSRVVTMDPDRHDMVMAAMSHVPHILSYAFAEAVAFRVAGNEDLLDYAGGSFRDFTRIAGSSPEMWEGIFMMNRKEIVRAMKEVGESLRRILSAIRRGDAAGIARILDRARDLSLRSR